MTTTDTQELTEQLREALRMVIDPELGYNIVDLGLIYSIGVEDGGIARITMTTTTRGCPATSYLRDGAEASASSVPGIGTVDVALTYDPPWSPRMMSKEAKQHLGIGDGERW